MVKNTYNIDIPIKIKRNNLNASTNHSWVDNILKHSINSVNPRTYFTHIAFFDEDKIPMGIVKFTKPTLKTKYTELNYNVNISIDMPVEFDETTISATSSSGSTTGVSTSAIPAESDLLYDIRNIDGYIEMFETETDKVKTIRSINPDIDFVSSTTGEVYFDTPFSPESISFKISTDPSDNFAGYPTLLSEEYSYLDDYDTT
jgi:hypothetical protein